MTTAPFLIRDLKSRAAAAVESARAAAANPSPPPFTAAKALDDLEDLLGQALDEIERLQLVAGAADRAITTTLDRAQTDADLGHHLGPLTETFAQLCEAEALRTGETLGAVKARRGKNLARYPRRFFTRNEVLDSLEADTTVRR